MEEKNKGADRIISLLIGLTLVPLWLTGKLFTKAEAKQISEGHPDEDLPN